ncbi:MAG TPA: PASTA domain-containing protein [Terriglobia bacterium]|nr:PASTA domain-containing protein [Terriglobia bacterium]
MPNRLRSLFRLFLLFTVLLAVALLSAITTVRLTIHGRQENMPKLLGVPLESAERITSGLGLELKVEDKIYSTQYPPNSVAQQMPPPGTPLKMGQHVHVLVSLGPPQLTVPNLVGGSVRAARITAIQRGLTVGEIAVLPWPGDPDQVVAQDPPPATADVRTPTVNLLVAGGQNPPSYLCPRFIGQPVAEVRRILERNSFKVGDITPVTISGGTPGVILTQSPPAGSKIGPDAVFSFQVTQ